MIFKFEFQPLTSADMTTSTDTDIERCEFESPIEVFHISGDIGCSCDPCVGARVLSHFCSKCLKTNVGEQLKIEITEKNKIFHRPAENVNKSSQILDLDSNEMVGM